MRRVNGECVWICALVVFAGCGDVAREGSAPCAPRADSDEPKVVRVTHDGVTLGALHAAVALPGGRALVVREDRALVRVGGGAARVLLDEVVGAPALVDAAHALAARATAPGESDLWLVPLDGGLPRAIAAARGADGQPFVLADGRVLFVSDRGGVAGVFLVDPRAAPHEVRQLTNAGERPGALSSAFVPPPVRWLAQRGSRVRYDAGDATVELDVLTGHAEVL